MDELRIGVCECTRECRGKLEGQQVTVSRLEDKDLAAPMTFILREVPISESRSHDDVLLEFRCHFFVDLVKGYDHDEVEINVVWLSQFGGSESIGMGWGRKWRGRVWGCQKPPPPNFFRKSIISMIQERAEEQIQSWLAELTPSGWELSQP